MRGGSVEGGDAAATAVRRAKADVGGEERRLFESAAREGCFGGGMADDRGGARDGDSVSRWCG